MHAKPFRLSRFIISFLMFSAVAQAQQREHQDLWGVHAAAA